MLNDDRSTVISLRKINDQKLIWRRLKNFKRNTLGSEKNLYCQTSFGKDMK